MKTLAALLVVGLLNISGTGQTNTPDSPTASQLLKDAEATASSQHRNILLVFSASWCAPCHRLQSFLNDPVISPIFDRYFVKLIVDYGEHTDDKRCKDTQGADELIDALHERETGVPLIVMLNSSGKPIVDSILPVYGRRNNHANFGYPTSPTEIDWFLEMLRRAAPSLTPNESETIKNWLVQHSDDVRFKTPAKH